MQQNRQQRKFLLWSILTLCMLMIGTSRMAEKESIAKADSVSILSGTVLYLDPTSHWDKDGAYFAAYFFNDSSNNAWAPAETDPNKPGLFMVTSPGNYNQMKFVRMAKGSTELNWYNRWNETWNLDYDGINSLYTITNSNFNSSGYWGNYESWVSFSDVPLASDGIDKSKVRIWIKRNGRYSGTNEAWWIIKAGDKYYTTENYVRALYVDGSGNDMWFGYFDIPLIDLVEQKVSIGVTLQRNNKVEFFSNELNYVLGDNNKVWNIDYVSNSWVYSKVALTTRIYNSFFAKVLEGYLTCDPNISNGYGAFNTLTQHFLPLDGSGNWNMQGDLCGQLLCDFANVEDYESGVKESEPNTDGYVKYLAMKTLYESHFEKANYQVPINNTTNFAQLLFGALVILSFTGFIVIKRNISEVNN